MRRELLQLSHMDEHMTWQVAEEVVMGQEQFAAMMPYISADLVAMIANKQKITKIVLTGGPCAGKTSALSKIEEIFTEKGYKVLVVGESATEIINSGIKKSVLKTKKDFQLAILRMQKAKEELYYEAASKMSNKVLIVCDRGTLDGKAYLPEVDFQYLMKVTNTNEIELRDNYDAVFHLVSAAKGAKEYYKKETQSKGNTFKLALKKDDLTIDLPCGQYIMGIYLLDVQREIFHTIKHAQHLIPVVFDCQIGDFITDNDICEQIFSASQSRSEIINDLVTCNTTIPLQMAFNERITEVQDKYKSDYTIRTESNKMVLRQRIKSQYEKRIRNHQMRIESYQYSFDTNKQRLIPALKGQIKKWEEELQAELNELDRSKIAINPSKLISLSVVIVR